MRFAAPGTPWRWSTSPRPYLVGNIGHQVELVNGALDGEFREPIGSTSGGFVTGIIFMGVAYLGYKHAKRKRWI